MYTGYIQQRESRNKTQRQLLLKHLRPRLTSLKDLHCKWSISIVTFVSPGPPGGERVQEAAHLGPPRPLGQDPLLGLVIQDPILYEVVDNVHHVQVLHDLLAAVAQVVTVREIHYSEFPVLLRFVTLTVSSADISTRLPPCH